MLINIIESGCGSFKTQNNKTLIQQNPQSFFLVIVPSIELTKEYHKSGKIIHSDNSSNVQIALQEALQASHRVIITTHKAFLDCSFKDRLCRDRIVIQDEQLSIFQRQQFSDANHKGLMLAFTFEDKWNELILDDAAVKSFITNKDSFDNINFVQDLINGPYKMWTNQLENTEERFICAVLNPSCYNTATEVIITCANFTNTLQYKMWEHIFDQEFEVKRKFERYVTPNLTIHYAQQINNGKYYNLKNQNIRDAMIEYIGTNDLIYVDNNCFKNTDKEGWDRATHNCAGMNEYRTLNNVVFLSALNYDLKVQSFLGDIGRMSQDEIKVSLTGELLHQVAMRCSLRDDLNNTCNIYLMDKTLALYASTFLFDKATLVEIDNTQRIKIEDATKKFAPPVSQINMNKASAIRKKFPEFKGMSVAEIMGDKIWGKVTARGEFRALSTGGRPKESVLGGPLYSTLSVKPNTLSFSVTEEIKEEKHTTSDALSLLQEDERSDHAVVDEVRSTASFNNTLSVNEIGPALRAVPLDEVFESQITSFSSSNTSSTRSSTNSIEEIQISYKKKRILKKE